MARICDPVAARVVGPYLKEMARLAHTEYLIEGRTAAMSGDILRETHVRADGHRQPAGERLPGHQPLRAGGPRLLQRGGRADRPGRGRRRARWTPRSSSVPPTSTRSGRLRIGVGATLVRHSDPASEADETRAKAAGLLEALRHVPARRRRRSRPGRRTWAPTRESAGADERNDAARRVLARGPGQPAAPRPSAGRPPGAGHRRRGHLHRDDRHQLRPLGCEVSVRRFDEPYRLRRHDLVIVGPGPGDPQDTGHPKIAHLRDGDRRACWSGRRPFLAVCLGHQVLSTSARAGRSSAVTRSQPGGAAGDRPVRPHGAGGLLQHLRRP